MAITFIIITIKVALVLAVKKKIVACGYIGECNVFDNTQDKTRKGKTKMREGKAKDTTKQNKRRQKTQTQTQTKAKEKIHDTTIQYKTRQDKTRQDNARQHKTTQDNTRQHNRITITITRQSQAKDKTRDKP